MPQPTLSATLPDLWAPWLVMIGFGAYHGLNPGMGWLFALSLGLQQNSEKAIWRSMIPIALGHAASLALVAVLVLAGALVIPTAALQAATGLLLISFGMYKVFRYYRHPRWIGMRVGMRDLAWWSFLMAMAHGAGLMIAPALIGIAATHDHAAHMAHTASAAGASSGVVAGVLLHTLAMLAVMVMVAWVVYRHVGLAVLRRNWINFDLIWAVALLVVGGFSLLSLV